MNQDEQSNEITSNRSDYVAFAAKAALGAIPFVGSLLVEIAGTVIPNQRIDRIARFAAILEQRLGDLERDRVRAYLTDENFTDLVEEGLRQAARSTTDERRQQIAAIIESSLTAADVSFIESKHLLRILGEINDIEVIWLRFYLDPMLDGDEDFRAKHKDVIGPRVATIGSKPSEVDQAIMQDSYKAHLEQLGLLRARHKIDSRTKLPEYESGGQPKILGYEATPFGRLLMRQLGFKDPYRP